MPPVFSVQGDFDDLPSDLGGDDWLGLIPPFFSDSNITCGDWSRMSLSERTEAMRRWLVSRYGLTGYFDVPANLGYADSACARQLAESSDARARAASAARARAEAAEFAAAKARERQRAANAAATAYAQTPTGRAQRLLGQLGTTCQTWLSGNKDSASRVRSIQLSLRVSEDDAIEIRNALDAYCGGNTPVFAKATFINPYIPKMMPTAGIAMSEYPIAAYCIGGVAVGAALTYFVMKKRKKSK
jgi:hypothetical protein